MQQDQKKDIPWIESTMQSFDEPNAPNVSTRHSTISDLVVDGRRMMKDEKMLFTRVSYTDVYNLYGYSYNYKLHVPLKTPFQCHLQMCFLASPTRLYRLL